MFTVASNNCKWVYTRNRFFTTVLDADVL